MLYVFSRRALVALAAIFVLHGCRHLPPNFDDPLYIEMVAVKGGTFLMGDIFDGENDDALPVHQVRVKTFRIARYEVTFEQYDAFARETGRPLPSDGGYGRGRRAVVNVSWSDARAFCDHRGFRLPTEAEWEYASRSGGLQHRYAGTSDSAELPQYAYLGDNSPGFSAPVGMKNPNELGLHDMTGNAAEWVGAYYEHYIKDGEEPQYKDLQRPGFRIVRGGSFATSADPPAPMLTAQTFWRSGTLDDVESFTIGFRCAD